MLNFRNTNLMLFAALLLCNISATSCSGSMQDIKKDKKKTIVVLSLDAFRWDYPGMYSTPTLDSLTKVGTNAVTYSCFPGNTFPNHYAMATGLHPNNHGIVDNTFHDKASGLDFALSDRNAVENPYFWKGEPIWTTAVKQGKKSFVYYWPGSETTHDGIYSSLWKKYDSSVPFSSRADSVAKWLALPEAQRPELIMWYYEEPDAVSHKNTPLSKRTQVEVEYIDATLNKFFNKVREIDGYEDFNFIITADHGMVAYKTDGGINLYEKIDTGMVEKVKSGNPAQVFAKSPEYIDQICEKISELPNLKAWRRENLPEKYHYGSDADRIGDIIILPDPGYYLNYNANQKPSSTQAVHGYDPWYPDMQTFFVATGPAFKQGFKAESFQNLNLYNIIARTIGLTPANNDGDQETIEQLFR